MSAISLNGLAGTKRGDFSAPSEDIVELSLLLPSWQAAELETAAQDRGLTTGQMVRQLIREFFDHLHNFGPQSEYE